MSRGTGRLMISLTSPLMSIMLIFLGILRTTHSRVRHRNTPPRRIGYRPTVPTVPPPVSIGPARASVRVQCPPPPSRFTASPVPCSHPRQIEANQMA